MNCDSKIQQSDPKNNEGKCLDKYKHSKDGFKRKQHLLARSQWAHLGAHASPAKMGDGPENDRFPRKENLRSKRKIRGTRDRPAFVSWKQSQPRDLSFFFRVSSRFFVSKFVFFVIIIISIAIT